MCVIVPAGVNHLLQSPLFLGRAQVMYPLSLLDVLRFKMFSDRVRVIAVTGSL